jgi:hypothetical protein
MYGYRCKMLKRSDTSGNNHIIIAVEDHGNSEEEKHGPGKFVDPKRVYYFRDSKAFHLFILLSLTHLRPYGSSAAAFSRK